jgi:two-component system LytT family response regulator
VDDVPLARERIRIYLEPHNDIEVIGEYECGRDAAREISRLQPDLAFLDVQLPDVTGFEILAQLPPNARPLVIFLTAYEEHAVQAFDVSALDYLVKPVDRARFEQALNRARAALHRSDATEPSTPNHPETFLERLAIRDNERTELVSVEDVDYIDIAGHYLCIHVGTKIHLMRGSLRDLGQQLDPAHFARIHRSKIVRLDRIRYLRPRHNGDFELELHDGTTMTLSRSYSPDVLDQLGGRVPGA